MNAAERENDTEGSVGEFACVSALDEGSLVGLTSPALSLMDTEPWHV